MINRNDTFLIITDHPIDQEKQKFLVEMITAMFARRENFAGVRLGELGFSAKIATDYLFVTITSFSGILFIVEIEDNGATFNIYIVAKPVRRNPDENLKVKYDFVHTTSEELAKELSRN